MRMRTLGDETRINRARSRDPLPSAGTFSRHFWQPSMSDSLIGRIAGNGAKRASGGRSLGAPNPKPGLKQILQDRAIMLTKEAMGPGTPIPVALENLGALKKLNTRKALVKIATNPATPRFVAEGAAMALHELGAGSRLEDIARSPGTPEGVARFAVIALEALRAEKALGKVANCNRATPQAKEEAKAALARMGEAKAVFARARMSSEVRSAGGPEEGVGAVGLSETSRLRGPPI